jgi:hypothetical protein
MLRKLKWQIPGEPLAARYDWSQSPVPGRGPAVEKHWSKACVVYDRLNIEIAGSSPAWGMDVCPRVSVLCCPVSVEALRRADPPAKEPYQMSLYVDREAH